MAPKVNVRIIVADDHGIVRMGLIQTIKRLLPTAIITEVEDYKSLYKVIQKEELDLAIMDVNMPNGTVQEAIDYIKMHQPDLRILVFFFSRRRFVCNTLFKNGCRWLSKQTKLQCSN